MFGAGFPDVRPFLPRELTINALPGHMHLAEPALPRPPRAKGIARVSAKRSGARSMLDGLHQSGALKLLFPRNPLICEAIAINTSGGVTGGDSFHLTAAAGQGAHLCLTTQAAERAYRALSDEVGHVVTDLQVADDATLFWLPQELILFQGSSLCRRLNVDLAPSARFLMIEPVIFGRTAMGEIVTQAQFDDRIEIRRDGVPLYLDAMRLSDDPSATLARPAVANGARAMASLVYVAPDAEAALPHIRAHLPETGGASLLHKDVLTLRLVTPCSHSLRRALLPILDHLTGDALPRSWRL